MRPRDTQFQGQETVPGWLLTLARQLGGAGEGSPQEILGPLAALDETSEVARSIGEGRGWISEADRRSLQTDLTRALAELGDDLSASCAAVLAAFRSNDLPQLRRLLEDSEGARLLAVAVD